MRIMGYRLRDYKDGREGGRKDRKKGEEGKKKEGWKTMKTERQTAKRERRLAF